MTLKLWQKRPKLHFSKDIIDIVQFGSSVIEGKSPNDIDIAVIFNKIPVKDQLNQAQKIKEDLKKIIKIPVHIKAFDFYSLFNKANFSKDNIILYGRSLISGDYFSNYFGFKPKILIKYYLRGLKKKDKVRFNYSLNGKKGKYGMLKNYGGKILSPGLIEIEPEFEEIFINSMKKITAKIEVIKILKHDM
ncbi:MAG: hypothetical protein AABW50_01835 [Nanoarchaeota archaeon]